MTGTLFDAVLLDRDGTLVVDVPYNGDPALVRPMPGAREALDRLRAAGLRLGVVTNQSGLARGRFTAGQMAAVNRRVEELLGPFDDWQICPHDDTAGCGCRKPAPGMVIAAADALGVAPGRCAVVGDIGRDMEAALAAGATGILVPTGVTLPAEVAAAPHRAAGLTAAADLILQRQELLKPASRPGRPGGVLAVRSDSAGDVLVTGPAIRALASGAGRVVLLCGPRGRAAAELLPGVDEIIEWRLPWIDPEPGPVDPDDMRALTDRLRRAGVDEAVIFTSFHQSALPLALLLRLAGIGRITAISDDYPGSLLDVRHRVPLELPEAERARSVAAAAGFALPASDDGRLRVTVPPRPAGDYLVVHPGASCEARACPPESLRRIVAALAGAGHRIVVTGGPGERHLAAYVAGAGRPAVAARLTGVDPVDHRAGVDSVDGVDPVDSVDGVDSVDRVAGVDQVDRVDAVDPAFAVDRVADVDRLADADRLAVGSVDIAGPMSFAELGALIAGARCLIVANTGPAHLAAAVGTPVISLYAPTVPYGRWGPYRVPAVRLGDAAAACRDTRATRCPVPGHPCLSGVTPDDVLTAVRRLGVTAPQPNHDEVAA